MMKISPKILLFLFFCIGSILLLQISATTTTISGKSQSQRQRQRPNIYKDEIAKMLINHQQPRQRRFSAIRDSFLTPNEPFLFRRQQNVNIASRIGRLSGNIPPLLSYLISYDMDQSLNRMAANLLG